MKYILALAALATSILAQTLDITAPVAGSTVAADQPLFVDLKQELGSGILDQIGLIMSLKTCNPNESPCSATDLSTGFSTIIYNGTYDPTPDFANPQNGFHQNFTLSIPATAVGSGPAILTIMHFLAVDAALTPAVEIRDVQFNIQ